MAGQGTLITATDYNTIQAKIALVLGSGSGDYGYGQSVSSSSVAANAKISVTQWTNLRNDLVKAYQHQTGITVANYSPTDPGYTSGNDLKIPTTALKLVEIDRAAYNTMADAITTSRLAVPPSAQATRENLVAVQTRTASWNGTLSQTITVSFADANAARYYFNTGSRFEFSSSRTGGVGGAKDISWSTILTGMATIYFNISTTTCTGSGNTSAIGYAGLTTSDQVVFSKDVSGSTYYPNQFRLKARAPAANQIIFTLEWADASGQPNAPWGTDEDVTGTLTSTVQVYRSSGDVTVSLPPAGTTAL